MSMPPGCLSLSIARDVPPLTFERCGALSLGYQSRRLLSAGRRTAQAQMWMVLSCRLTMRLSDAGLRRRQTKPIYPDHRPSPWLTVEAPRDRSNRLLACSVRICADLNKPILNKQRAGVFAMVKVLAILAGMEPYLPFSGKIGFTWTQQIGRASCRERVLIRV